jgi:predicted ArsR family transcriptional regulator
VPCPVASHIATDRPQVARWQPSFQQLARRAPELVCELNHQFLAGLLAGLRTRRIDAVLQPDAVAHPRRCCVLLQGPVLEC